MVLEEENAKLTVAAVSQLTFGGKGWKKDMEDGMPRVCAERYCKDCKDFQVKPNRLLRRLGAPKLSGRRLVHKQRTHLKNPDLLEGNSYEKTRKNSIIICLYTVQYEYDNHSYSEYYIGVCTDINTCMLVGCRSLV